MNTPPTAPRGLDHFESALLTELREHVTHRRAPNVVAEPPRRHSRRWVAGLAVAAASATVFVVAAPGGPGASPAYAVTQTADGDVVVTIHRLEDAAGLEEALRAKGIDADVSFDSFSDSGVFPDGHSGAATEGTHVEHRWGEVTKDRVPGPEDDGFVTDAKPFSSDGDQPELAGCGNAEPAVLRQDGDDWVLTIPAESPMQDRPVQITTSAEGNLAAFFLGDAPDSYCAVVTEG